jgi:glycosyltransferase involved in cell wall biosynthesis
VEWPIRLLVCATEAPLPPFNGMRLQLHELCRRLALRHDVTVVAFRWPDQHGEPPPGLDLQCLDGPDPSAAGRAVDRVRSVRRRQPVDAVRLTPLVAEGGFDLAHVGLAPLAALGPALSPLPAVLAPLDALTTTYRSEAVGARPVRAAWLRGQSRIAGRFVARTYPGFARVVLVSDADERETARTAPLARTAVIPNGVDTDAYRPDPMVARDPSLLLFTGALHAAPNVDAVHRLVRSILPRVRRSLPHVRLAVVGRAPTSEVQALGRRDGVEVVGDVDDLRPWLAGAGVYVCPMATGTGIKNKLLEAMACGAPSVATPLACRGLQVSSGEELLVADDDDALAAAVCRLARDGDEAAAIGRRARAHVVAHHSWDDVARRYEALYAEVIGPRG